MAVLPGVEPPQIRINRYEHSIAVRWDGVESSIPGLALRRLRFLFVETSPQIVRSRSAWAFLILLISAFFIVVAVSSTDGRWIVGVFGVVFLFLGTSTLTNHVVVADRLLFRKNLFGLRTRQIHLDRLRSVRFEPATRQGPVLDLADHQDQIRLLNKDCKINELLSVLKPYLDSAPMDEASRKEIARKLA